MRQIVCDDKEPPWFNKAIKSLIQEKKNIQNIQLT